MKIFWKIVIVVVIVAPIIICWKTLQTVWDDDELASSGDDYSYRSGDLQQIKDLIKEEDNKVTASNLGDGVEYDPNTQYFIKLTKTSTSNIFTDDSGKIYKTTLINGVLYNITEYESDYQ